VWRSRKRTRRGSRQPLGMGSRLGTWYSSRLTTSNSESWWISCGASMPNLIDLLARVATKKDRQRVEMSARHRARRTPPGTPNVHAPRRVALAHLLLHGGGVHAGQASARPPSNGKSPFQQQHRRRGWCNVRKQPRVLYRPNLSSTVSAPLTIAAPTQPSFAWFAYCDSFASSASSPVFSVASPPFPSPRSPPQRWPPSLAAFAAVGRPPRRRLPPRLPPPRAPPQRWPPSLAAFTAVGRPPRRRPPPPSPARAPADFWREKPRGRMPF